MGDMDLRTKQGMLELQHVVKMVRPDVVVIDTVRSSFPGMQENSAEEWSRFNQLCTKLRNAGMAVIAVHHANKGSSEARGGEAGSTNQLTVLENQLKITQVYQDKETAQQNMGIYDGDFETSVWSLLYGQAPTGFRVTNVMEVRYGKVREWTDEHDRVNYLAFCQHDETGKRCIVSNKSTKQKAKAMALDGHEPIYIAEKLHRPVRTIMDWLAV
jgi:hypothetical protein